MIGLSAPPDPTFGGDPPTIFGRMHDLAFVVLGLTFWPALLTLAWGFLHNAQWSAYAPLTIVVSALVGPAFLLKGLMFYGLLVGVIAWCETIALHLWHCASTSPRSDV